MRRTLSLLAASLTGAICLLGAPALVSAHGTITSNLSQQRFETAPDHAEFTAEVPVDVASAKAQLRYLGEVEVDPDLYFAENVPTLELSLVQGSPGTSFAFDLPELGKGTYALDWEVTPLGDHATQAVQLFVVSVGVANPDPVPPAPTGAPALTAADETADSGLLTYTLVLVAGAAVLVLGGAAVVRIRQRSQG